MSWPVTFAASGQSSQRASEATFFGGIHKLGSAPGMAARLAPVSMVLGEIKFAVMPEFFVSLAMLKTNERNAAFEAE
jgi:hypothetical protein